MSVKQGHPNERATLRLPTGQRRGPRKQSQPKKPKGHDALLQNMVEEQCPVRLIDMNGGSIMGIVSAHDKYTISMNVMMDDGDEVAMCFYKHGVMTFCKASEKMMAAFMANLGKKNQASREA